MPVTEQTQLQLVALRDALTAALAKPAPVATVPPRPAPAADVMKQLAVDRPDLVKLIGDRATALQQRAAEEAKAHEGLKQIYTDALSRVTTMLKGGKSAPAPPDPRGDRRER